jgi:superfamily I DNA and/or RNA helicase
VSTSTGASDPRLMAACGLGASDSDDLLAEDQRLPGSDKKKLGLNGVDKKALIDKPERTDAPDGLPPLSMPFVIVDEACQSVEPASLIPMTASNSCRSLVLLGDPCQLPATVKSDPDSVLTVSLMERLAATLPQPSINVQVDTTDKDDKYLDTLAIKQARSMMRSMEERGREQVTYRKRFAGSLLLSVQYRMHPSIAAFASAMFYDSLLSTPSLLGSYRPFPSVLHRMMPCGDPNLGVRFINVGGRCNEKRGELKDGSATVYTQNPAVATQESTSYSNHAEAVRVVNLIKQIIAGSEKDPFAPKSIGVITPYNGQVQLIKRMIAGDEELRTLAAGNNTATIEVKSVDGYQGRERDVIIFSAVRSNRRGNLGFLTDWRRLNVAMTRARNALLVVGDMETLMEGDKHWAAFVKWCQGVHCVIDDTGNPEDCESL